MTLSEVRDRNDFRKDLPSHVFCDATQDKVILWLDKAEEYFGIEFSRRGLRYLLPWRFMSNRGLDAALREWPTARADTR